MRRDASVGTSSNGGADVERNRDIATRRADRSDRGLALAVALPLHARAAEQTPLVVDYSLPPPSLDPVVLCDIADNGFLFNMYVPLLRYETKPLQGAPAGIDVVREDQTRLAGYLAEVLDRLRRRHQADLQDPRRRQIPERPQGGRQCRARLAPAQPRQRQVRHLLRGSGAVRQHQVDRGAGRAHRRHHAEAARALGAAGADEGQHRHRRCRTGQAERRRRLGRQPRCGLRPVSAEGVPARRAGRVRGQPHVLRRQAAGTGGRRQLHHRQRNLAAAGTQPQGGRDAGAVEGIGRQPRRCGGPRRSSRCRPHAGS